MIWLLEVGLAGTLIWGRSRSVFFGLFCGAAARSWDDVDIVDGGGPSETSVGSGGWEES